MLATVPHLWLAGHASRKAEITGRLRHTLPITGALLLADGRFLSWSEDCTLRLWSSEGEELRILVGHSDWVNCGLELTDVPPAFSSIWS